MVGKHPKGQAVQHFTVAGYRFKASNPEKDYLDRFDALVREQLRVSLGSLKLEVPGINAHFREFKQTASV